MKTHVNVYLFYKDLKLGLDQGHKDFALFGADISNYGKGLGTVLLDLLEKFIANEGRLTLRLRNVNPHWLAPSSERFCEFLKT